MLQMLSLWRYWPYSLYLMIIICWRGKLDLEKAARMRTFLSYVEEENTLSLRTAALPVTIQRQTVWHQRAKVLKRRTSWREQQRFPRCHRWWHLMSGHTLASSTSPLLCPPATDWLSECVVDLPSSAPVAANVSCFSIFHWQLSSMVCLDVVTTCWVIVIVRQKTHKHTSTSVAAKIAIAVCVYEYLTKTSSRNCSHNEWWCNTASCTLSFYCYSQVKMLSSKEKQPTLKVKLA